ncbi:2TM domain-containing protein [Winogradskyella jejuensis]|uniref:2TM domain-containing protein n=1 Tax=Winogradskyella jejuensis TaxID=1089305 RepID=A0A1M5SQH7_9FLAO|nr:2TM domain-containing protein [Winogradskyella jejuensis]SHH40233.1 2TM domain-containing protein [Winogradskyella jejuensis]
MKNQESHLKLQRAKRKIERLKGFYRHLMIFTIINLVIIWLRVNDNLDSWDSFITELWSLHTLSTFIVWGAILCVHAFSVFLLPNLLGYDWEERKIEQFMQEELNKKK